MPSTLKDSYSGELTVSPHGPILRALAAPEGKGVWKAETIAPTGASILNHNATRAYESLGEFWHASESASRPLEDVPPWRTYLRKRLDDFSVADSPGSPSRDALAATWNIVGGLLALESPTPSVVPGDDGAVELVWQRGGWHVELEIGPREAYVWAKERETGATWSGDLDEVRDLFRDLIAGLAPSRKER